MLKILLKAGLSRFNVANPNISDYKFCIGNMKGELEKITFNLYKDDKLESDIINHLKLDKDGIWSIAHYKFNNQSIYSTVSVDTTAYVIETKGEVHATLYKSKFSQSIDALKMISKRINDRPILMADCVMPETDMTWTSLLIFNGTEYEASGDHRVGY